MLGRAPARPVPRRMQYTPSTRQCALSSNAIKQHQERARAGTSKPESTRDATSQARLINAENRVGSRTNADTRHARISPTKTRSRGVCTPHTPRSTRERAASHLGASKPIEAGNNVRKPTR